MVMVWLLVFVMVLVLEMAMVFVPCSVMVMTMVMAMVMVMVIRHGYNDGDGYGDSVIMTAMVMIIDSVMAPANHTNEQCTSRSRLRCRSIFSGLWCGLCGP